MAETSLREGFRDVRDQARPSEINPKLEEAVQNQPLLPHLLSFRVVLTALAIGAVFAVILFFLVAPIAAGLGLIVVFFAAWFGLAARSYGKGQRTGLEKDVDVKDKSAADASDDDEEEEG